MLPGYARLRVLSRDSPAVPHVTRRQVAFSRCFDAQDDRRVLLNRFVHGGRSRSTEQVRDRCLWQLEEDVTIARHEASIAVGETKI